MINLLQVSGNLYQNVDTNLNNSPVNSNDRKTKQATANSNRLGTCKKGNCP